MGRHGIEPLRRPPHCYRASWFTGSREETDPASSGGRNRTCELLVQSQASLPTATAPESRKCPVGVEPTSPAWKTGTSAARSRAHLHSATASVRRKEGESNPQGSSLDRIRSGCRRQSACPPTFSTGGRNRTYAGPGPQTVNSRPQLPTVAPPVTKLARSDSNRRSPAPEAGGLPRLSHTPNIQSTQRELNPHFRHGKAVGDRYIMGAWLHQIVKEQPHPEHRVGVEPTFPPYESGVVATGPPVLSMGPDGLEPSPFRVRTGYAAASTLVPAIPFGAAGVEPATWSL